MKRGRRYTVIVLLVGMAVLAWPLFRAVLRHWESNPILRGAELASREGCFSCHSQTDAEVPNPGSRWGSVPRLDPANVNLYARDRSEIEGFVRHGAPDSWRDSQATAERLLVQTIRMPAFGERLDDDEIESLVEWACAVAAFELPGDADAARGRAIAVENGCPSCHGVEGSGGVANPGSLGGFIPGFLGRNFTDLVHDRAEFGEWIRTGTCRRLQASRAARFFWQRQAVHMPAFGDRLTDQEIDLLWAWVSQNRAAYSAD